MIPAINQTQSARTTIMNSIRQHLAESKRNELSESSNRHDLDRPVIAPANLIAGATATNPSMVEMFRERLEAVGGHCFIVRSEIEAATALKKIFAALPVTLRRRIALSDAPMVRRLADILNPEVEEIAITPDRQALFDFDVGITTAQAAIAETGTLVLESDTERHRLVSLVPPVHIAIVDAESIVPTLADALKLVARENALDMSRTVTFITGPSRTADIELTLAIGVHGPKELYVILDQSKAS
jgi:L-lactate dehydrogenase complex protein LldG